MRDRFSQRELFGAVDSEKSRIGARNHVGGGRRLRGGIDTLVATAKGQHQQRNQKNKADRRMRVCIFHGVPYPPANTRRLFKMREGAFPKLIAAPRLTAACPNVRQLFALIFREPVGTASQKIEDDAVVEPDVVVQKAVEPRKGRACGTAAELKSVPEHCSSFLLVSCS